MRFCLIHLDDEPREHADDEAAVIVPGGERVAMMVPLDALADFLPLLHEATLDLPEQRCESCQALLPGERT